MISTFTDLIRFIDASEEIRAHQKPFLRSAARQTLQLLGNRLADIRVEPREILAQLDRLSPAKAGMRKQSWTNATPDVHLFRLMAPLLVPARSGTHLTGPWQVLAQLLPVREGRQLSRFLHYDRLAAPGDRRGADPAVRCLPRGRGHAGRHREGGPNYRVAWTGL